MREAAALLLVSATIAGCGGGAETAQTPSTTAAPATTGAATQPGPSRAEYAAEADALCAELGVEGSDIAVSADELRGLDPESAEFREKAGEHFAAVLEFSRTFMPRFRELQPPPADRERVDQFLAASEDAVDALEDVVAAFERGQDPGPALNRYGRELSKADRLAEVYGFEVCGRNTPD